MASLQRLEEIPASGVWDRFFRAIPDATVECLSRQHARAADGLSQALDALHGDPGLITLPRPQYLQKLRNYILDATEALNDMITVLEHIDGAASEATKLTDKQSPVLCDTPTEPIRYGYPGRA